MPRRLWDNWDLPIANMAVASALATFFAGAALGIAGYFEYMAVVLAQRPFTAPPLMLAVFLGYVFATPRGLFALYLVATGFIRFTSAYIDEPLGDPLLTGVDSVIARVTSARRARAVSHARQRLERADEPDRRYHGAWADLPDVTWVVVSARRKPGWTVGTWVITNDGWFTLGEPFDRPTPNGLRTVYPLTLQTTTLDVLRKGVSYELPPLRQSKST